VLAGAGGHRQCSLCGYLVPTRIVLAQAGHLWARCRIVQTRPLHRKGRYVLSGGANRRRELVNLPMRPTTARHKQGC
jgi:hypothetical protein